MPCPVNSPNWLLLCVVFGLAKVTRFKAWMGRSGRKVAVIGTAVIGVLLIARGVITLL